MNSPIRGRPPRWRAVVHPLGLLMLASCTTRPTADPRMVSEWVHSLYGAIRVERLSPPVASRLTAYAATALYMGLAASDHTMPPLDGVLNGVPAFAVDDTPSATDGTLVAVAAERAVLDDLLAEALPTTRAALHRLADSLIAARVAQGMSPRIRAHSDSLGARIGAAIVAWSRTDGFAGTRGRPYTPPAGDGLWFNDAPATVYATQNLSAVSEFVALDNPANQQRAGNASSLF